MCEETITKTQIKYNRSRKVYQVISPWGEIVNDFPSGPQGKRAAELEALRIDDEAAYKQAAFLRLHVFTAYPETHRRIWKAGRIAADGQVYKAHPLSQYNGREAYHVGSQSQEIFYTVTRDRDTEKYACTCPDFNEYHAPTIRGQKLCKHIFSIKIMKAIERPIPAYLDSPANLYRFLEETPASWEVLGAYNRRPYLYEEAQQRPAVAGEIVRDEDGQTWRVMHNGQRFNFWRIGLPDSTAENDEEETRAAEDAEAIEDARRFGEAVKINQHERGQREKLRIHMQQAEIAQWKARKAAAQVTP